MKTILAFGAAIAAVIFASGAGADDKSKNIKPKTIQIDHQSTMPMATGCTYHADIKGTIKTRGSAELFDPNLNVVSEVRCPNSAALKTTENIASIGPMSYVDLEERLERRGTVVNPAGGCLYVPDFKVAGEKLETVAVRFLCERPSK
jgi:hypothetical protein